MLEEIYRQVTISGIGAEGKARDLLLIMLESWWIDRIQDTDSECDMWRVLWEMEFGMESMKLGWEDVYSFPALDFRGQMAAKQRA